MRIHRIPGISRVVITTNLDDYSGDHPSSHVKMEDQPVNIRFNSDGIPVLYYSAPVCPRCLSRNVSRNGTYMREVQGHSVRIQKYICNACSYSFEARPPGYGCGKHIPEDMEDGTTKARVLSSLRKAASMCRIFLGINVSHETIRTSVPDMPDDHDKECTVFLNSGQITKIIMRQSPPFHLLSLFSYSFPSLRFLPSRSWPPSLPTGHQDSPCNTAPVSGSAGKSASSHCYSDR